MRGGKIIHEKVHKRKFKISVILSHHQQRREECVCM